MKQLVILLIVACSHPVPSASPISPVQPSQPSQAPGVPATAAGRQLTWLIDVLARGGDVDRASVEAHFDPAFLANVPADKLVGALGGLAQHTRGMEIRGVTSSDAAHIVLRGEAPAGKFALSLAVSGSGQIAELDVGPDIAPPPASMTAAIERLRSLAPRTQLLVAEIAGGGRCEPRHAHNAEEPLALASASKLYILLALADHIIAGRAKWQDELTARDDWRSLPAGPTHDAVAGSKISLHALAERMISISDNTATDYLLYFLGRQRVETAMRQTGHSNPALNIPYLGTREIFWIKMAMSSDEVARYLALDAEPRRRALDQLAGKQPPDRFADWTQPRYIDRIEWFASSSDLCRLASALLDRAKAPAGAPLLDILAKNPALPKSAAWSYAGFKGGNEPGVMNGTWLLRRADDRWFIVTVGLNGPQALDEGEVVGLAHGVIDLVGREQASPPQR